MTKHCDKHDIDYEVETLDAFGHSIPFGICKRCEEEREKEEAEKKAKADAEYRISKLQGANIEPMYYDSTLDTFEVSSDEQARAKKAVSELIHSKTGKIVMLGNHGTGKTHLAVAAVRELGGKILSMYEISTRIRATYSPKAKEEELDVTESLARIPMLAIDEIGRTKGSDAETNWLSYIIDKRHVRGLPLILISNKHARKTCQNEDGCANCLENYISEDIMSRLREDGVMITFTGNDYRITKRMKFTDTKGREDN